MNRFLLKNANIINEGKIVEGDIRIVGDEIEAIGPSLTHHNEKIVDLKGKWLIPGIIDDQVHFREPGLTHKADIFTESRAAVAGGVTAFMEMPNTNPSTITQTLLAEKYAIAQRNAWTNYSFFMGATNDNLEEVLRTNIHENCGIKIFMGSSTGNMLVDNVAVLEKIFQEAPMLIAVHCEDEATIRQRNAHYTELLGDKLDASYHPIIRNEEACYLSSSKAVALAKKYGTRLHILHISTEEELVLLDNSLPLAQKRITAEACVHHLLFTADDYASLGNDIKCNPAIKDAHHAPKILEGLLANKIDIIATDHAPHTMEEKALPYAKAPSGLPLVQHSFDVMKKLVDEGKITIEKVVEKMCHAPADCFQIAKRGYIREGYKADLAVVDPHQKWQVTKSNIHYKCGWSPLENQHFTGKVIQTFVNGHLVYDHGHFSAPGLGQRLLFDRV